MVCEKASCSNYPRFGLCIPLDDWVNLPKWILWLKNIIELVEWYFTHKGRIRETPDL
jgi:hypothetical protein